MDMETLRFRFVGSVPLMLHNGQLTNPLNKWAKAIKEVAGKRKKTDADLLELARLEFMGGLYYDEKIGPYVPGECMHMFFVNAAKAVKLGKTTFAALRVVDDKIELKYKGPRDPNKMWDSGNFHDIRAVGVQRAKVMRCRPKFDQWSIEFTVAFDKESLDRQSVIDTATRGGEYVGLFEYRPRFGRFTVEVV